MLKWVEYCGLSTRVLCKNRVFMRGRQDGQGQMRQCDLSRGERDSILEIPVKGYRGSLEGGEIRLFMDSRASRRNADLDRSGFLGLLT